LAGGMPKESSLVIAVEEYLLRKARYQADDFFIEERIDLPNSDGGFHLSPIRREQDEIAGDQPP
jgi:hypothetical protein